MHQIIALFWNFLRSLFELNNERSVLMSILFTAINYILRWNFHQRTLKHNRSMCSTKVPFAIPKCSKKELCVKKIKKQK